MQELDPALPVPLAAASAWADAAGREWQLVEHEKNTIAFDYSKDGIQYGVKVTLRNPQTITVLLVFHMPLVTDELAFRRQIDELELLVHYGAFIYYHELRLLAWRDTISSADTDGSDFDSELFDGLISCGFDAFAIFRINFSDLFGGSAADMKLAQLAVSGRA